MFTAQAVHVLLLVIMGQTRRIEAGTRNDAGAQVSHDVREVAVAGRQRNLQMELEVRGHGITVASGVFIQGVQRRTHRGQVFGTAPLGRQPGRLNLQADAQFKNRQHITQRDDGCRVDAKTARARCIQYKGADAMPRLDLACGLQSGNGLAHHRTAYTMGLHDRRLGGQLVATLEHAVADLLGQHRYQLLREAAALAREAGYVVVVFHGEHFSRNQRGRKHVIKAAEKSSWHTGRPYDCACVRSHHSSWRLYDHQLTQGNAKPAAVVLTAMLSADLSGRLR